MKNVSLIFLSEKNKLGNVLKAVDQNRKVSSDVPEGGGRTLCVRITLKRNIIWL